MYLQSCPLSICLCDFSPVPTHTSHRCIRIVLTAQNNIHDTKLSSASYAGLKDWSKALEDAKECLKLNPQFVKGYYRLATAQLELKDHAAAEVTIRRGLSLDANNAQLTKVLKTIKQSKRAAAAAAAAASSTTTPSSSAGAASTHSGSSPYHPHLDKAAAQEYHDLQVQHGIAVREYHSVQADLQRAQREEKMYGITQAELESNPSKASSGGDGDGTGAYYYRSVGKLFLKSTSGQITDHLTRNVATQQAKQKECTGRLEYLEKRIKSIQLNMRELTGAGTDATTTTVEEPAGAVAAPEEAATAATTEANEAQPAK
jgi:tetratricopeptide (TPR) repeat protein